MLTYGPSSNTFMGQIGPFIDMYIRRTVLNGSNQKFSESRQYFYFKNLWSQRLDLNKKNYLYSRIQPGGLWQPNHPISVFNDCEWI